MARPAALAFRSMGTSFLLLGPRDHPLTRPLFRIARAHARGRERQLSRFRPDSELSQLNASAGRSFRAGPVLFAAVELAIRAAEATDGLFDPTVLEPLERWGYDRTFEQVPGNASWRPADGRGWRPGRWREIELDARDRLIWLPEGVRLDLGGIAKGWTVDDLAHLLAPLRGHLVDGGGDLATRGRPPDGPSWLIGVQDPHRPEADLARLALQDGAVATSGVHRRSWTVGGEVAHHLIDPRTGAPAATGLRAVTVVGRLAWRAEVLAKAALLLGPDEGPRWLAQQADAEGLFVSDDGAVARTSGLAAYLVED